MAFVEFDKVNFHYPNGFSAVEDVSFQIEKGENIAIVGQNGAGKTSMVKMMNGLLKPSSGTVTVDGMDTRNFTTAKLSRKVGYVFQNPDDQIFHSTVGGEIEYGPKVLGFDQKKADEMVKFAAELVHLEHELEENPYNLPLSTRKFVTIASVVAMDTDILILDEPTAGQDLTGIGILENMLKVLKERGKTVITITHDMEYVVHNFDKIFVMAHKNLLRVASAGEIFYDDELLETSMLKRPFISELAKVLNVGEGIVDQEELIRCMRERL